MDDYNKIIDSLNIRFVKSKSIKIIQPIVVTNQYNVENFIYLLHDGELSFQDGTQKVEKGDMLFVPGGKAAILHYGASEQAKHINNEEFFSNTERYFEVNSDVASIGRLPNSFSFVAFESKVFDSINFFASLDIPPFIISDNPGLSRMIKEVVVEDLSNFVGKERLIKAKMEQIVIEVIRYILRNNLFTEQLATNSTYFKDPRLIDIFNYIKEYLGGDLSNKVLASVANVSEDYVGQYFKMLTGINPQDYIEYQRMEAAVHLLRTSKKSIREIGQEVGYKDTAYFCRRFKMMFGIPAGKMRRRDSMINI
ncbi:MAG: AraC family transcriptional regulator [Microscillaceae bacterium]|nr:AraC family transcriptional regulator [Microscillaceae bacterium]MDW8460238.1 AraC family transcriptional regulator [Cytophagales bacterium]